MSHPPDTGKIVVLAEDNPAEQNLARRAFRTAAPDCTLNVVENGEELLNYLHRREEYSDASAAPRPDLVLLDLNMPKVDGRQVLRELKQTPHLRRIPIIVMSTSSAQHDIHLSYALGCSSYLVKPRTLPDLIEALRATTHYWLAAAKLPPKPGL